MEARWKQTRRLRQGSRFARVGPGASGWLYHVASRVRRVGDLDRSRGVGFGVFGMSKQTVRLQDREVAELFGLI